MSVRPDFRVEHLNVLDRAIGAEWDRRVASHPDSTVFHSAAWARVVSESYGHKPHYVCISRQNEPAALIPLIEVASPFTGRRGVCLPFSDACGPLLFGEKASAILQKEIEELAIERGWRHLEVRGGDGFDANPGSGHAFFGHSLHLRESPDQMMSGFAESARRAVRKALKSELSVETLATKEAIREFYRLHVNTRRLHGAPPQPFTFFENIHRHLIGTGRGFVVLARRGSRAIAGAVFLSFGTNAIYKYAASATKFAQFRGNNLVLWHAMGHLIRSGCQFLDFGRTSVNNQGLRRFKLSWGAEEHMIGYYRFHPKRNAWHSLQAESPGFHSLLFRNLPVSVNRLAGAMIYPHLD